MAAPTEAKVKTASAGAIAAGLIDWALAKWLFPHGIDATGQALILAAVPGSLAYAAGWAARHTPRVQAQPVTPPAPPPVTRSTP
jgi:hypothetical protein